MTPPSEPKIYHIVHVDRLPSIIADRALLSDAALQENPRPGTTIGMGEIKQRRLESQLSSHPGLCVGECVPFYFCPRSVMLYLIHRRNRPGLEFLGGQDQIVHLEADLHEVAAWAKKHGRRWAFTLSNAGAYYFQDRCDLSQLGEIDWKAVQAQQWQGQSEGKQAEFLMERSFTWSLVRRIGVLNSAVYNMTLTALRTAAHLPEVSVEPRWYY